MLRPMDATAVPCGTSRLTNARVLVTSNAVGLAEARDELAVGGKAVQSAAAACQPDASSRPRTARGNCG
jgi:hypothetical protein